MNSEENILHNYSQHSHSCVDTMDGVVQKDKNASKTSLYGLLHVSLDVADQNKSDGGDCACLFMVLSVFVVEL